MRERGSGGVGRGGSEGDVAEMTCWGDERGEGKDAGRGGMEEGKERERKGKVKEYERKDMG